MCWIPYASHTDGQTKDVMIVLTEVGTVESVVHNRSAGEL